MMTFPLVVFSKTVVRIYTLYIIFALSFPVLLLFVYPEAIDDKFLNLLLKAVFWSIFPLGFFWYINDYRQIYKTYKTIGSLTVETDRIIINQDMAFRFEEIQNFEVNYMKYAKKDGRILLAFNILDERKTLDFLLSDNQLNAFKKVLQTWHNQKVDFKEYLVTSMHKTPSFLLEEISSQTPNAVAQEPSGKTDKSKGKTL